MIGWKWMRWEQWLWIMERWHTMVMKTGHKGENGPKLSPKLYFTAAPSKEFLWSGGFNLSLYFSVAQSIHHYKILPHESVMASKLSSDLHKLELHPPECLSLFFISVSSQGINSQQHMHPVHWHQYQANSHFQSNYQFRHSQGAILSDFGIHQRVLHSSLCSSQHQPYWSLHIEAHHYHKSWTTYFGSWWIHKIC